MADPVLGRVQLMPFQLNRALTEMIAGIKAHRKQFALGSVRLKDAKQGTVDFNPYDPEETLDSETGRSKAIDALIRSSAEGSRVIIKWKKCEETPKDFPKEGLQTIVSGEDCNELIVGSRVSASVIDYVTNQLYKFSKNPS